MNFLTFEEAVLVAEGQLGFKPKFRDAGTFESALMRPQWQFMYDRSLSLDYLAAELLYGLARQQGLVDGNKRTAWICADIFYKINGLKFVPDEEQQEPIILRAAVDEIKPDEIQLNLIDWRIEL